MKKLTDRLSPKVKRECLAQARITRKLYEEVERNLKKDGIKWQQLIQAALEQYLEEKRSA